ncbi:MAG: 3-hydroxyacyl-CoA dehydrogenase/enoyl-CoA hydratase family protein [Bacteroidetes bacterium]|nr:MAG: 3-hydroxyacyl-CoA dehydrogenase/enoyl-CoA hydratase family protein [Bacteroidota bacterium]
MARNIQKVAVIGSGVMGSRIACHLANAGCEVILLDIQPKELNEKEVALGMSQDDPRFKQRIVRDAFEATLKSSPSPLYHKELSSLVRLGTIEEDLGSISDCDWIIEAIIENLDIKKGLFEKIETHRRPGTLISSNTSGIPMMAMCAGRSEDFQQHFFGSHFFNPPRYLPLLELIPGPTTNPEIISFMEDFGSRFLGKMTVVCKDTPAFIANRIGVYAIMSLFHLTTEMELSVEEVDKLTGPVLGRPKSATFRTCDVVGLDTLVHVANGLQKACPNDEANQLFQVPAYINKMIENKWLGSKSKQGFYKKIKNEAGKSEILSLDLDSMEYRSKNKVHFPILDQVKAVDNLKERTKLLLNSPGKAGDFYRKFFGGLFAYVSNRVPEISDEIYKIDDAIKAGFGWEMGAFETWDILGLEKGLDLIKSSGNQAAEWIQSMIQSGTTHFYEFRAEGKFFYNQQTSGFELIPGQQRFISLDQFDHQEKLWENQDCSLVHLGDGILNLEFQTKMNTIGGGVLAGINKAIDLAEKSYSGLVISNRGQNFSAGANVGMIFMMAAEQDYDELNFAIRSFQNTMMRLRYSSIPVVVAPHNMCLGGGCEMAMHADKVVAHAELYMGLVEFGVGLIPGGGGTKEFAKRLSEELHDGDIRINRFRDRFLTIGQAKVSTSAAEAFELGYLRAGTDEFVMSRQHQLQRAKQACLELAEKGYQMPIKQRNITVLGQEALGIVYVGANSMFSGNYISDHDKFMSEKLGNVLAGGDLSEPSMVSEQYLLDLERRTFLELCQQRKTLERLQSLVKTGKILRN